MKLALLAVVALCASVVPVKKTAYRNPDVAYAFTQIEVLRDGSVPTLEQTVRFRNSVLGMTKSMQSGEMTSEEIIATYEHKDWFRKLLESLVEAGLQNDQTKKEVKVGWITFFGLTAHTLEAKRSWQHMNVSKEKLENKTTDELGIFILALKNLQKIRYKYEEERGIGSYHWADEILSKKKGDKALMKNLPTTKEIQDQIKLIEEVLRNRTKGFEKSPKKGDDDKPPRTLRGNYDVSQLALIIFF